AIGRPEAAAPPPAPASKKSDRTSGLADSRAEPAAARSPPRTRRSAQPRSAPPQRSLQSIPRPLPSWPHDFDLAARTELSSTAWHRRVLVIIIRGQNPYGGAAMHGRFLTTKAAMHCRTRKELFPWKIVGTHLCQLRVYRICLKPAG